MSILIFGGTVEGRTLAEHLRDHGIPVTVCVATEYGASMMQEDDRLHVITGRQTPETMLSIMERTHSGGEGTGNSGRQSTKRSFF